MKTRLFLGLIALLLVGDPCAAQHITGVQDPGKRQAWKREAVAHLRSINPTNLGPAIVLYESNRGYDAALAFNVEGAGHIRFPNGEWVYILAHSGHDDPSVGDVILAVDQDRNLYEIAGHACGGIAFFLGFDMKEPTNSVEFLTRFKSNVRDRYWEKLPPSEDIRKPLRRKQ